MPAPAVDTVERRRIVASKLSAPLLRAGIVDRPELLEGLSAAPVVLVSAPAGYGKTTLLALWRAHDERPFAWVSVDARDNDPVALVTAVLHALASAVGLDGGLLDALNSPDPPIEDVVLPWLVDECANRRFVLVLDDVHLVTDARCHAAISFLGERLPEGCQLALATRMEPPLPLASWRAHGQLAEVRARQLSLRQHEAGAVLAAAGVRLESERVERLVERTEGWPAAMYLAALSLRDRADADAFVDRFAGTSRHVADFLTEDVLARQSPDAIDFLLRTSVLEELTGSLCDAVTERADSEHWLRELERTNLFLVPLDEERTAYRYHHLFAQYLRAELARRDRDAATELHRRAWRWYRDNGLPGRAVMHAHAAGDVDVAAELVSAGWLGMTETGQFETLRGWLAGFDGAHFDTHAPLAIAGAWVAALGGEGERCARLVEAARHGSWNGPMPDGTVSLESALAIMSCAFGLGGLAPMRAAGERAAGLEPRTSPFRPMVSLLLGVAQALDRDYALARETLAESIELTEGDTAIGTVALSYLARIELETGDEKAALRVALRGHAVVERPGLRNYMPSIGIYSVLADLLARGGDLDGAARAVERSFHLLPKLTHAYWWQMIETRIRLVRPLLALGRRTEAKTLLADARDLLETYPDAGVLRDWHAQASRLAFRLSSSERLSDAELRVLRLLASDLTLREIGGELFLSPNTVKTHTRSIYRKLGLSSRAEARGVAATVLAEHRDGSPG